MRLILGPVGREHDVPAAAGRYLLRQAYRGEARWHPRLASRQPVDGAEHLAGIEGGAVLNFLHHGLYDGIFASVRAATGRAVTVIVDPNHLAPDALPWKRQHIRVVSRGGPILAADAGYPSMLERVRDGEIVALATDVPHRLSVHFLGRERRGAFGAAKLAMDSGAPMVVATSHPYGRHGARVRLHAPLHPADFASGADLLQAALAIHEPALLAWPEAYDKPNLRWG